MLNLQFAGISDPTANTKQTAVAACFTTIGFTQTQSLGLFNVARTMKAIGAQSYSWDF